MELQSSLIFTEDTQVRLFDEVLRYRYEWIIANVPGIENTQLLGSMATPSTSFQRTSLSKDLSGRRMFIVTTMTSLQEPSGITTTLLVSVWHAL